MKGEGLSKKAAFKLAEDSFASLLPNGPEAENQNMFTVIETATNEKVGILWFAVKSNDNKKYAFIYDIELSESVRGKGYGRQTMQLLEKEVKDLGLNSIGLHVFGHNTTAINLYEKMGFRTTNRMMAKDLI